MINFQFQYKNTQISKDFLLTQGFHLLSRRETFAIDDKIIAVLDVSSYGKRNCNTIILHMESGIFVTKQTSRKLMNGVYTANGFGFAVSKFLAKELGIQTFIPLANAYFTLMPIVGASRGNADWIAPRFIRSARLNKSNKKKLDIEIIYGNKIQIDFPKGDFEKRLHSVSLINECSFLFWRHMTKVGSCQLVPPEDKGIFEPFERCNCPDHMRMRAMSQDLPKMIDDFKKYILINLKIEELQKIEVMKYYSQNLSRLKRLN